VPLDGCFPLAPSFDHAGPMARTVEACTELMPILADGFEPGRLESLEELEVGVAWLELADPLVRARAREAAERFPRRRPVDFPLPERIGAVFMREVADVHRELFAEFADSYGENVRTKVERCLEVTDREHEEGLRARVEYTERCEAAFGELDLLLTPTLAFVAPPLPVEDLEIREATIRLTYPFNVLGWPALAVPCGAAEGGLPASVQLVSRLGADSLVLAAGELLDQASPV
jgi:Asp-tRNA(Asn)/Glu-tRNA(Gln) amidotransferase A subunit family amidase